MSRRVGPTGGRRLLRVVTAAVTICACIALQGGRDTAVAGRTVGVSTPPLRAPLPAPAVPPTEIRGTAASSTFV